VERGVIATASELFNGRHYPSVVALCTDALDGEPECVPLLLLRARAHVALRRDLEAQADLRDIIRLEPQCAIAYRLLGELAARRHEHEPAAVFFREALRLDPGDREAAEWLLIADASIRPAAVAQTIPAPATAAGRFPSAPAHRRTHDGQPRFARGTHQPDQAAGLRDPDDYEERPTKPFARSSERPVGKWTRQPAPTPDPLPPPDISKLQGSQPPQRLAQREVTEELSAEEVIPLDKPKLGELATIRGRAVTDMPPAKPAPRLAARPITRSPIRELPGFGEYLVAQGILTHERLRAAQAYQRSMKVQLSTAIVTLGLATPQRIEWASVAHQSQVGQRGQ
jgi:tetratricopeptide (TPR) repeat protein